MGVAPPHIVPALLDATQNVLSIPHPPCGDRAIRSFTEGVLAGTVKFQMSFRVISHHSSLAMFFFIAVAGSACSSESSAPVDAATTTDVASATDTGSDAASAPPGLTILAMSGCRNCHQSTNAADGTLSGQTEARPMTTAYGTNLTPDMATGLGGRTEAEIVAAIREGVGRNGRTLCPTMPRYRMMTPENAALVARYLLSIPAVNRAIPASVCAATDGGADASATDASADR